MEVTRLAPSPTGALHPGNARTFLINWALARQQGWKIILRMEDLDGPRIKTDAAELTLTDLQWLGLDWDHRVADQASELTPCHDALAQLAQAGRTYHCQCSRKDIKLAQSAPHVEDHELRYPGTCRDAGHEQGAVRVRVPDEPVTFVDQLHGPHTVDVQAQVGDFVITNRAGQPAYQLAVVVDDARQGVTQVVRGDDLLRATARQIWLYRWLGLTPLPRWWHLPLVLGPDGHRLAKRHGDSRLASYREAGVPAERVIGLIAHWSGVTAELQALSAAEFQAGFVWARLPREPVVFTEAQQRWLTEG